jgi:hypothetical protein
MFFHVMRGYLSNGFGDDYARVDKDGLPVFDRVDIDRMESPTGISKGPERCQSLPSLDEVYPLPFSA